MQAKRQTSGGLVLITMAWGGLTEGFSANLDPQHEPFDSSPESERKRHDSEPKLARKGGHQHDIAIFLQSGCCCW